MAAPKPDRTAADPPKTPRSPSGISDIFLARLADLEGRVEKELGNRGTGSPSGELVLDLARALWQTGASLVSTAVAPGGPRAALAWWMAAAPVDELGLDTELAETVREIVRPLSRRWLGLKEVRSAPLPAQGGVLVLLNRSAWPLPVEALVLGAFLADGRLGGRRLVVLWEEDLSGLPWISDFFSRIGIVAATPSNAGLLLERGAVVVAFPEGASVKAKTYERRYRLARFEAAGLIAAAMEAGAAIVPGAVVGNEESFPLLGHVAGLPVTAHFPLLGPLGLLPLPLTWRLRLGAAVDHAAAGGRVQTDAVSDATRARMQALLGELLADRSAADPGRPAKGFTSASRASATRRAETSR